MAVTENGLQNGTQHGDSSAGNHSLEQASGTMEPLKVVVCGAGPAGLLLAHYLMSFGEGKFQVTIHDKGEDPRETMKQGKDWRRFTIGIAVRGQRSMELVPDLLHRVKKKTVSPDCLAMLLPFKSTPVVTKATEEELSKGWVIDRFSLCASLTSALGDLYPESLKTGLLKLNFNSSCTGVDLQKQEAYFVSSEQSQSGDTEKASVEKYDLLVGADGLRSVVRLAFQQQIRGFEVQQQNIPGRWTVAHYDCPKGFTEGTFHMLPNIPRSGGLQGLGLPSQDGSLCFILGWMYNRNPKEWLACSTPAEARAYLDARIPYMRVTEEAAWKMRMSPLQTSAQVKCWQYHDNVGHAVLIGDAAHATSPNIGQGCNASLVDASVLARLLLGEEVGEHNRCPPVHLFETQRTFWNKNPSPGQIKHQLPSLLARFSALQVKEGHALVDISAANGPANKIALAIHCVLLLAQLFLHKFLPFLFSPPVMTLAGATDMPLSSVYQKYKWQTDFILSMDEADRKRWDRQNAENELSKKIL